MSIVKYDESHYVAVLDMYDNRNLTQVWSLFFMSINEIQVTFNECHNSSYVTYRLVWVLLVLRVRETL